MKKDKSVSQLEFLMDYFQKNPNRPIEHPEIVDWVVAEYKKRTGEVFRDPDRGIRQLSQQGYLKKLGKGVYMYDPSHVENRELEDFTQVQKKQIFKRDGYRCVMCGRGKADGIGLHPYGWTKRLGGT